MAEVTITAAAQRAIGSEDGAALRAVPFEFLNGGGTDEALRERTLPLSGGVEALDRAARIREGQRQLVGRGGSTEDYFQHKRAEIEREQEREGSRSDGRP